MQLKTELYWFDVQKIMPVRFYRYTSIVTNYIFWLNPVMNNDFVPTRIREIFDHVKQLALMSGKISWDNKVVVECSVDDFPHNIFMGYKDHALVLGFSVEHDSRNPPIELEVFLHS